MIGIGIANSLGVNLSGLSPATKSFVTAAGISDPTKVKAINDLVIGLQSSGLWSKMKAVYPFVTDNRNLLSYTEDFSNAYWFKQQGSITANTIAAPNGTTTADSFFEDTVSSVTHGVLKAFTLSSATAHTYSVYVKQLNGREAVTIRFGSSSVDGVNGTYLGAVNFTFATQVISGDLTSSVEVLSNGWYRLSVNITPPTTALSIALWSNNGSGVTYTGDVTKGFYLWGAQLELGSTATTYQPIATTQQAFISNQFKFNLVNPVDSDAAFRLVFNGGWTHSAQGATPNGTNGFADTKFIPSSSLSTSSAHFAKYNRTNDLVNFKLDGCSVTGVSPETFFQHNYTSANAVIGDVTSLASYTATDTRGLFNATRTATNSFKVFRNTSNISSSTNTITVLPNRSVYLGARNDISGTVFYNTYQVAFTSIGDGLLDAEATALYNRVQNFQLALNRAV